MVDEAVDVPSRNSWDFFVLCLPLLLIDFSCCDAHRRCIALKLMEIPSIRAICELLGTNID